MVGRIDASFDRWRMTHVRDLVEATDDPYQAAYGTESLVDDACAHTDPYRHILKLMRGLMPPERSIDQLFDC